MKDFIQLVLVKHIGDRRTFLFRAPFNSVKIGQRVKVETCYGIQEGTVVFEDDFSLDYMDKIMKVVEANGATWPLKRIVACFEEHPIEWEEEEQEEE